MTLPRDEVIEGFLSELAAYAALARSLDDAEWKAPSRCEGWSAGDLVGHVSAGITAVTNGEFEGLGTPEVIERHVTERRSRPAADVVDELDRAAAAAAGLLAVFDEEGWAAPAPGGVASSVGFGVEGLWYDAFLHGDDVRAATGRPSVGGHGLRASVSHVAGILTDQGWGPAVLALDGQDRFPVGSGDGQVITGDPLAFVLAATGRSDPARLGLDATVNIYR